MKLLHKTVRIYLQFSIVIFIVSIPFFYFTVQKLWIQDLDESLLYQKAKFVKAVQEGKLSARELLLFSKTAAGLDLGITLKPSDKLKVLRDTIYYYDAYDPTRKHVEPFRELSSVVLIDNKPYQLVIRKDLVENADLIKSIIYNQCLLFLFLLTGVVLLNNYFSKKTWRPFYSTLAKLKSFKLSANQSFQVELSGIEEFDQLNRSLVSLTDDTLKSYNAQKEFTENAAHETQTPIAVIKGHVEMLSQSIALSREESKIITGIEKNIRLLTKLNRGLLLLSKIENGQFDKEAVSLEPMLASIVTDFKEQIDLKGISLIYENQDIMLFSNRDLLTSLMINLLSNAVKYTKQGGVIIIKLSEKKLSFTNTGIEEPLLSEKIFSRFYKQSSETESSGLGLAIVKEICSFLDFKAVYSFSLEDRHTFDITFNQEK